MIRLICALLILSILIISVCSFEFAKLHVESFDGTNISFIGNKVGQQLQMELLFNEKEAEIIINNEVFELCLMINGLVCECYQGRFKDLQVVIGEGCLVDDDWSFYYLSALIKPMNESDLFENVLFSEYTIFSKPLIVKNQKYNHSSSIDQFQKNSWTLVLTLTLSDLSRVALLFLTLEELNSKDSRDIFELIIIVPDAMQAILKKPLMAMTSAFYFRVRIIPESKLFIRQFPSNQHPNYPYAVQMALKLLVSKIVNTYYYLTLDADNLLIHADLLTLDNLLIANQLGESDHGDVDLTSNVIQPTNRRGIYHHELFSAHRFWWQNSAQLLRGKRELARVDEYLEALAPGFGVTPALLNTFAALTSLSLIYNSVARHLRFSTRYVSHHCINADNFNIDILERRVEKRFYSDPRCDAWSLEALWMNCFGINIDADARDELSTECLSALWSEYTIYRLSLDHFRLFDALHVSEQTTRLSCNNIWYEEQLPWRAEASFMDESCLFSVVQSTANPPLINLLQQLQAQLQLKKTQ